MPDPRDAQVHKLLHKIVYVLVDQPQFVIINTLMADDWMRHDFVLCSVMWTLRCGGSIRLLIDRLKVQFLPHPPSKHSF